MSAPSGAHTKKFDRHYFAGGQEDAGPEVGYVTTTPGAEAANAIDVVCAIFDSAGVAVTSAKEVFIETLAVTADQGDLAAASAAVGTLVKAVNPTTGPNIATMTSTAAGLFSFKVTDTAAEVCHVRILAEGCRPKIIKLTFA